MDPVALITGGARRSGAEIARQLHDHCFNVILHYRRSEAEANAFGVAFLLFEDGQAVVGKTLAHANAIVFYGEAELTFAGG